MYTVVFKICSAISRTTIEQKCAGGVWFIKAAVAEETPSADP